MIDKAAKIPEDVLDKHLGILGITGSGKTYCAKGAAESLLDRGLRICVIDPTGVWYGLKSSVSGKSGAYPVVVFGGPHADIEITGSHGEAVAEAIGTSSTPSIIDVSLMRGGERTRFFADFAETIRVKNKGPLYLFIDEAHLFIPQGRVSDPQSANMLHAANNLISLGRSRGLRVTIISQRPAKVHKDSLTQIHSLIAMRLIAPQDRAAVEDWISGQADPVEGKRIISSLPTLKTGEGWLWAPELEILERMRFPKIKTFDSSRAPDAGDDAAQIVLAPINLDAIQTKLSSIKTDATANDPASLKRRIADLERQVRSAPPSKTVSDPAAVKAAFDQGVLAGIDSCQTRVSCMISNLASTVFEQISKAKMQSAKPPRFEPPATLSKPTTAAVPSAASRAPVQTPSTVGGLSGPQGKIMNAMQFWRTMGHDTPTREQVAGVAGYSAGGGSFQNTLSQLRQAGHLASNSGALRLTSSAGEPMTSAEAATMLRSILNGPQLKVLAALSSADTMTREEVAQASGYEASGGSFQNILSRLNVLGIIHRPGSGLVALSDWARDVLA